MHVLLNDDGSDNEGQQWKAMGLMSGGFSFISFDLLLIYDILFSFVLFHSFTLSIVSTIEVVIFFFSSSNYFFLLFLFIFYLF